MLFEKLKNQFSGQTISNNTLNNSNSAYTLDQLSIGAFDSTPFALVLTAAIAGNEVGQFLDFLNVKPYWLLRPRFDCESILARS